MYSFGKYMAGALDKQLQAGVLWKYKTTDSLWENVWWKNLLR